MEYPRKQRQRTKKFDCVQEIDRFDTRGGAHEGLGQTRHEADNE
jgi:hypothetical protein